MCHRPSEYECCPSEKTEREALAAALARTDALKRAWCADGKLIIEAARKHLATLPEPTRTVWFVKWGEGYCYRFSTRKDAMEYGDRFAPNDVFITVFSKEEKR